MNRKLLGMVLVTLFLAGCASGRNYNSEVGTLNARITSLQSQLEAKDREISALHDQVRSLQQQNDIASRAKSDAERRLDQSMSQMSSPKKASGYDKVSTQTDFAK